ncbi:MAG: tetratricopeptide repeat protein [Caldilineaceae bacterium]
MAHRYGVGNRYELLDRLGAGGMGQVYRAVDRLTGETIALKRVITHALEATTSTELRLALTREFQTLAGLRHPNIIGVRDYGFDGVGQPYFTMDLLYNPRTLVAAGQFLTADEKLALLLPVLHALAYLHRRGIVHRDLKPGNILVSGEEVKVLDFGLTTLAGQATPSAGTLRYMAPELINGQVATAASDLYALGIIAYELFAGWHPFAPTGYAVTADALRTLEADWSYVEIEPALLAIWQRLLAKDPGARYSDATAVIEALNAATHHALPLETKATRESFLQAAPFIGRADELHQLMAGLEEVRTGQATAYLVVGESGVGKSRLINEVRVHALVQGFLVLRGQANGAGGSAYQLWQNVLRWLPLLTTPSALEAAVLKPVVHDLESLLGVPIDDAPPLEPKAAQDRLITTVTELLRRSARQQPLLLLLEDVHWADDNSLTLLQWLNRLLQEQNTLFPLCIVATYRRGEAPQLLQQLPGIKQLLLQRFHTEQTQALSIAMLGQSGGQPHLVNFLQQETEGNTFFLVEVLRTLAEEAGQLSRIGAMTLPKAILPGGVEAVVQRRLQRIPAHHQPLLQLAAVAGRQVDLKVLTLAMPQANWNQWVDLCANAAILEWQDEHWHFSHDKLREALLRALPPDARQQLHSQVGRALERCYAAQLAPHYATLAYHFGQARDHVRERDYLTQAATAEKAAYANSAAIEHYTRLLELVDQPVSVAILLRLGEVLQLVGRWDEAEARYRAAATVAATDATTAAIDELGACYQALGALQRIRGDFAGALHWLHQAQSHLADTKVSLALSETLLEIGNVYYLQGEYKAAWDYLQEGLQVAKAAEQPATVASALHRIGSLHYSQGQYDEARTYAGEALTLYTALQNKVGMANALNNLANIDRGVGDYKLAQERRMASLVVRREIGDQWGIAASLNNLAVIPYLQGDYATAAAYWQESLALREELGDRWGAAQTLDNLGLVAFSQGDYGPAAEQHTASLALRRTLGDRLGTAISLSNLAHAELYQQEFSAAVVHYRESLALSHALDDKRGIISCCIGLVGVQLAIAPTVNTASPAPLTLAVKLLAFADHLTQAIGAVLERDEQALYMQSVNKLQSLLSTTFYTAAWDEGGAMTEDALLRMLGIKELP